eukprot:3028078-Rhodomonas_salina.1
MVSVCTGRSCFTQTGRPTNPHAHTNPRKYVVVMGAGMQARVGGVDEEQGGCDARRWALCRPSLLPEAGPGRLLPD